MNPPAKGWTGLQEGEMIHDLSFADVLFILLVGGIIYGFVSLSGLNRKKKPPVRKGDD